MSDSVKMISVQDLELGMYIDHLDRPWIETSLLFQKFQVCNESELDEIKNSCEYVYIDTDYGTCPSSSNLCLTDKTLPDPTESDPGWGGRRKFLSRSFKWKRLGRQPREPLCARELSSADETYQKAQSIISNVMGELRAGGELDIATVEKAVIPMINSVLRNPDAMACLVSMKKKDDYTYSHMLAVSIWLVVFGRHLGFDKDNLKALGMGGILLDIGKTRISTELLTKKASLEDGEMDELRRHVEYGLEILAETKNVDSKIETIIRTHHERHDGSGYPLGMSGDEIPVVSRIAGIVDTYDAMSTTRPYQAGRSTYEVMRFLLDQSDVLFQAEIIERFIQVVGLFPTATLVELNTGEVGVVMKPNLARRLRPIIMLILDEEKNLRNDFPIIDLSRVSSEKHDPDAVWIERGLDPGEFDIDPMRYYL